MSRRSNTASLSGSQPYHAGSTSIEQSPARVDEETGLVGEKPGVRGDTSGLKPRERFWLRLRGKDRPPITWRASLRAIVFSSFLNVFIIFLPFAWVAHWYHPWRENHNTVFALCFLSIIALEKLFDWGAEQMSLYLGEDLGDLLIITLNNAVEATLAIILLVHCELKLLQSTIVGVVLLHLLLIPGTGFLTGGVHVLHQHLDPHESQLNQSLLIIGVMSLVVPTAFFSSLNRTGDVSSAIPNINPITDAFRDDFLRMARGAAVLLLLVYIGSRIYLHNPPGDNNALKPGPDAPREVIQKEQELEETEPEVNPWACVILLVVAVALMAVTAEFLVESVEHVREESQIEEEWFGLFLLPIVSFSADGVVSIVYFIRSHLKQYLGTPSPPSTLAEDRAIDLSVQFTLFWMPLLVLIGWWSNKPMNLLFDLFEVSVLVASCFLVNYVTADAKTNWAEGMILVIFYFIISLSAWFYPGQPEIRVMNACESIVEALVQGVVDEQ